jgi:hypothetical protein
MPFSKMPPRPFFCLTTAFNTATPIKPISFFTALPYFREFDYFAMKCLILRYFKDTKDSYTLQPSIAKLSTFDKPL